MSITLKYWNGRGLMDVPRIMLAIAGKVKNAIMLSLKPVGQFSHSFAEFL